jgi:SAM-dependent methyltransferase
VLDFIDRQRDPLTPPRRLDFVGGTDHRKTGEEFKQHFIELGGLRPELDVLDVGCGIGRMAVPLLGYLNGRYEGFDIVPAGIAWCRKHITSRNPRFRFRFADIRNGEYNPRGRHDAASYRFPYEDAAFDFVFATSVFTHLLPAAARNYIRETSRVLRPDGTFFATFFMPDVHSPGGEPKYEFSIIGDGYMSVSAETPELAIAYRKDDVEEVLASAGLKLCSLHPGSWSGQRGATLQDVVIASTSQFTEDRARRRSEERFNPRGGSLSDQPLANN